MTQDLRTWPAATLTRHPSMPAQHGVETLYWPACPTASPDDALGDTPLAADGARMIDAAFDDIPLDWPAYPLPAMRAALLWD